MVVAGESEKWQSMYETSQGEAQRLQSRMETKAEEISSLLKQIATLQASRAARHLRSSSTMIQRRHNAMGQEESGKQINALQTQRDVLSAEAASLKEQLGAKESRIASLSDEKYLPFLTVVTQYSPLA